jgi:hypothetical protein
MDWTYRIIRHPDGTFALHEAFYDNRRLSSITAEPVVDARYDSPDELREDLANMLVDAKHYSVRDFLSIKPCKTRRKKK